MLVEPQKIPEVIVFTPQVFGDERGFFYESFNEKIFKEAIQAQAEQLGEVSFVQDNHSKSQKGVLRGLHYQLSPSAQGKLVRVAAGEVFDVAVDIRKNSPTFGQWVGMHLSAENKKQMWIPAGFAHGFIALADDTEFLYKTTNYYNPSLERSILWNDPDIGIVWPFEGDPIVSAKDKIALPLAQADLF